MTEGRERRVLVRKRAAEEEEDDEEEEEDEAVVAEVLERAGPGTSTGLGKHGKPILLHEQT